MHIRRSGHGSGVTHERSTSFALLAVQVERSEQALELTATLNELAIPVETLSATSQSDSLVIFLRIASGQVQEAIVALGVRGFLDVKAYGDRSDRSPER